MEIGDHVQEGQVLARVRPNEGAETDVVSLFDGRVDEILIEEGLYLERGQQVAVIKGETAAASVRLRRRRAGQAAQEGHVGSRTAFDREGRRVRVHAGEVTSVSKFPLTEDEMFLLLENQSSTRPA